MSSHTIKVTGPDENGNYGATIIKKNVGEGQSEEENTQNDDSQSNVEAEMEEMQKRLTDPDAPPGRQPSPPPSTSDGGRKRRRGRRSRKKRKTHKKSKTHKKRKSHKKHKTHKKRKSHKKRRR